MAIVFANLGTSVGLGGDAADDPPDLNDTTLASSYSNNASFTPPASGLIIVFTHSRESGTGPVSPAVSGNGLNWTKIAGPIADADGDGGLSLFAADASESDPPTTESTLFDFSAVDQTHLTASFFHATGVDLSDGVTAAFVQVPTLAQQTADTTGAISLNAAGNAANRPIACFHHAANEVSSERSLWTEADDMHGSGRLRGIISQWRDDAFETTASASWATSSGWCVIAAELKAEVGTEITSSQPAYLRGQQAATPSSQPAYLKGQAATSSSAPAYLEGTTGTPASASQPAYLEGAGTAVSTSQAAYLEGAGTAVQSNQAAFMAGQTGASSSAPAYVSVAGAAVTSSQPAYLASGGIVTLDEGMLSGGLQQLSGGLGG
jgi:hypothetical protein